VAEKKAKIRRLKISEVDTRVRSGKSAEMGKAEKYTWEFDVDEYQ
jgi:hypothetical protein